MKDAQLSGEVYIFARRVDFGAFMEETVVLPKRLVEDLAKCLQDPNSILEIIKELLNRELREN